MLGAPGPYAAWVSWLEAYGRGEDLPIGHLAPIDPRMGPEMFERLMAQVDKAFTARQRRWTEALGKDLRGLSGDPVNGVSAVAVVLNNARRRLGPLRAFTEHPAFTSEMQESLRDSLKKTVKSAQESLVKTTKYAPFELRAAVRDNDLLRALPSPPAVPLTQAPPQGRRVIL
ncbi:hypothetical protein [Umezawaea sp. NPDC059074]|uniref:hypothetical protein n=1 Tax=Umezawaea sp. NPDC059074 TaxID=3346716 RepID=UPI0036CD1F7B